MPKQLAADPGASLRQGDQQLQLVKMPNYFTARMKPQVSPDNLTRAYAVAHEANLARQNLAVFSVAAEQRDAVMEAVRDDTGVEFASHVYQFADDPTSQVYLTDEITIQFTPQTSDAEIEALTTDYGLALVKELPDLPRTYVFRVTAQATKNPLKIANELLSDRRVKTSEPNIVVPVQRFYVPSDPLFGEQWHLDHQGGPFLAAGSHIDVVRAWDITRGDRAIIVAVADDGFDLQHDALQGANKIVAPRDFAGRDADPTPGSPGAYHGTACAAVAVAEENGRGVVGVAPGCALMPLRTSGMLDDTAIEELFDWVIAYGAAVVSCSWGPTAREFPLSLRKQIALQRAATRGRNGRGCLILFAAGNANRPIDGIVDEQGWPAGGLSGKTRWYNGFAASEHVMAVAASTSLAKKAAYSNWGPQIAVCAPSNNTYPQIYDPTSRTIIATHPLIQTYVGRGVVTADPVGAAGSNPGNYTRSFGGTSSACPTVAGVAALVLSANPNLTAQEVRRILETTTDQIVDRSRDQQLGHSYGEYTKAGHSQWFGYGKVNAFRAVTAALGMLPRPADGELRHSTAIAIAIPDNNPVGVRSTIAVSESAHVGAISVEVDLSHTYIGDLRIALIAPSGVVVVLHDRHGATDHDIRRSFDLSNTPGLHQLTGEPVQGDWTLHIQDLALSDQGVLHRWAITIAPQRPAEAPPATFTLTEEVGEPIVQGRTHQIERTITAATAGRLIDLEVDLDLTHPRIGNLLVELITPTGAAIPLHQRTGGARDTLITTYTTATTPALRRLRDEQAHGEWRLRITDLEGKHPGKLNRWAVHLTCAEAAGTAPQVATAKRPDDLTAIHGIGRQIARHLHEAGITTYAQVAALTPEALLKYVNGLNGMSIERVKAWITQAKKLARLQPIHPAAPMEQAHPGIAPDESKAQYVADFTLKLRLNNRYAVQHTEVVYVQTGDSATWQGWHEQRLIEFVDVHATSPIKAVAATSIELPAATPVAAEAPPADSAAPPDLQIHVNDLPVEALPAPAPTERPAAMPAAAEAPPADSAAPPDLQIHVSDLLVEVLQATTAGNGATDEERLHVQFTCYPTGAAAQRLPQAGTEYVAQIVLDNLDTRDQRVLVERRDLLHPWTIVSADIPLPEAGRYSLKGAIQIVGTPVHLTTEPQHWQLEHV